MGAVGAPNFGIDFVPFWYKVGVAVLTAQGRKTGERPTWLRFSAMGFEFAAAVAGLTLVGYWIDSHYETTPKGTVTGAVLGIVGGGYNLIRQSLTAVKEAEEQRREHKDDKTGHA